MLRKDQQHFASRRGISEECAHTQIPREPLARRFCPARSLCIGSVRGAPPPPRPSPVDARISEGRRPPPPCTALLRLLGGSLRSAAPRHFFQERGIEGEAAAEAAADAAAEAALLLRTRALDLVAQARERKLDAKKVLMLMVCKGAYCWNPLSEECSDGKGGSVSAAAVAEGVLGFLESHDESFAEQVARLAGVGRLAPPTCATPEHPPSDRQRVGLPCIWVAQGSGDGVVV